MTYASGGLIEETDYNGFVASVNAIWGVGSSDSGYGQTTTLSTVAPSNTVTAAQWSTLIARINSMQQHQSGSSTSLQIPTTGDVITYLSTLSSSISTITTNRLSAISNGTATTINIGNTTTWITTSVKEVSLTFANTNAMRHFFNAGGYVTFTVANSTLSGNTKSTDWDALLAACGTVRVNAQTSQKVGGSGTPSVNNTNLGFYDLTTSNQTILQQFSTTATGGYNLNNAVFQSRLNASPGSSTVMFLRVALSDASADETLPAGSNDVQGNVILTYAVVPPSTTYITDSWGTITAATVTNTQS
jgi:hypothetical protein